MGHRSPFPGLGWEVHNAHFARPFSNFLKSGKEIGISINVIPDHSSFLTLCGKEVRIPEINGPQLHGFTNFCILTVSRNHGESGSLSHLSYLPEGIPNYVIHRPAIYPFLCHALPQLGSTKIFCRVPAETSDAPVESVEYDR